MKTYQKAVTNYYSIIKNKVANLYKISSRNYQLIILSTLVIVMKKTKFCCTLRIFSEIYFIKINSPCSYQVRLKLINSTSYEQKYKYKYLSQKEEFRHPTKFKNENHPVKSRYKRVFYVLRSKDIKELATKRDKGRSDSKKEYRVANGATNSKHFMLDN